MPSYCLDKSLIPGFSIPQYIDLTNVSFFPVHWLDRLLFSTFPFSQFTVLTNFCEWLFSSFLFSLFSALVVLCDGFFPVQWFDTLCAHFPDFPFLIRCFINTLCFPDFPLFAAWRLGLHDCQVWNWPLSWSTRHEELPGLRRPVPTDEWSSLTDCCSEDQIKSIRILHKHMCA